MSAYTASTKRDAICFILLLYFLVVKTTYVSLLGRNKDNKNVVHACGQSMHAVASVQEHKLNLSSRMKFNLRSDYIFHLRDDCGLLLKQHSGSFFYA